MKSLALFSFESLAALSQLLYNENVEPLNVMACEKLNSFDELAETSGRSIKDVSHAFLKLFLVGHFESHNIICLLLYMDA